MTEEEVDLLVGGMEDNQGQINYEGMYLFLVPLRVTSTLHTVIFILNVQCSAFKKVQCTKPNQNVLAACNFATYNRDANNSSLSWSSDISQPKFEFVRWNPKSGLT